MLDRPAAPALAADSVGLALDPGGAGVGKSSAKAALRPAASREGLEAVDRFAASWEVVRGQMHEAVQIQLQHQDLLVQDLVSRFEQLQAEVAGVGEGARDCGGGYAPAGSSAPEPAEKDGPERPGFGLTAEISPSWGSRSGTSRREAEPPEVVLLSVDLSNSRHTIASNGDDVTPSPLHMRKSSSTLYEYTTHKEDVMAFKGDDGPMNLLQRLSMWWSMIEEPRRTGRMANLTKSAPFRVGANLVILMTTGYTIMKANHEVETLGTDFGWGWYIGHLLSMLYVAEVAIRMSVHRLYFFVNEDSGWNVFDFCLVFIELWTMASKILSGQLAVKVTFLRSLRVLRVTRLLRIFKLISTFQVLRLLLEAMLGSLSTVMWCGIVILFALTISALMFVQLVADFMMEDEGVECGAACQAGLRGNFGSVLQAMLSLFMATSGGNDWTVYYEQLQVVGQGASSALVAVIFFFQFGMFNLLTSMFVDRAMKASRPDVDMMIIEQRSRELQEATRLRQQLTAFDENQDGMLTLAEFKAMLHNKGMSSFLAAAGLEISDAEVFFASLKGIAEDEAVPVDMFVQGCMRLKGQATSIDMQALSYEVRILSQKLGEVHRHQLRDLQL